MRGSSSVSAELLAGTGALAGWFDRSWDWIGTLPASRPRRRSSHQETGTRVSKGPRMNASVQVMVLVTVGVIATVYAFYLDVRREAADGRFITWLKTERSDAWDALSRKDRFLTIRAVEILRRGPLADDAEFQSRYAATRHGARFALAMTVAAVAITLLVLGTLFWNWSW